MIQLIAILCLAVYGALISLLVGLKHDIAERLRVDDSKAGILFSGFMFAGAVGVIVLSASIDLLGHALVSRFGFGFTAAALLLLAFCRRYGQYLSVYVLLSVGAMCIISVGNTLLPLVLFGGGNAAAATNLGNGFYGVGAFFVSFFLTGSLQHFGYRATVLFFAGLLLGAAVLASLAEYPVIDSHFNFGDLPAVLTSSFFLIALVTNFFGAGVENGVSAWANTYMSRLGAADKLANRVLSLFFIAVMVSRLVTATFVTPANTPMVLLILALIAIVTLVVMTLLKNRIVAAVGVVVLGLAMGSVCPNIFGYMFSRVDPAFHGTAFGITFATGLLGASILPYLIGAVSKRTSLRRGYLVNLAGAVLFGLCAVIMLMM